MKKICVYIDSMNRKGGIERVVSNLYNQLKDYYEITILTTDNNEYAYEIDNNIKRKTMNSPRILNMNKSKIYRIFQILGSINKNQKFLRKIINEYDYFYVTTPLNSLECYLAGKKLRKKLVVSEHASFYACNIIYKMIRRFVYPKVYCVSVPNKMDVLEYKKWNCNALYIPHLLTFEKNNIPNKLDTKIILNIGRLTRDKRQSELLDMWNKVENKNDWKLWIVGDGEEKERLEEKIKNLNLSESVKLLNSMNNISEIYKEASIFAFCSKAEGFGMVLLEAMSFGIPCISFDCPSGPRDMIISNYNGFLIENNDFNSFKEKIEYIINLDITQLKNLGNNSLKTIENWDNEKIIEEWKKVYK